jgi:predicted HTH domain antitoxin
MDCDIEITNAFNAGKAQGMAERAEAIAIAMLKDNFISLEIIAKYTGVPLNTLYHIQTVLKNVTNITFTSLR